MFFSESNFLETTLCLVVILIFLYWLYITVVTDEFKSGWNQFTSAYLRSNHAKILVASTLTIMMFMFISFSSILFIMSIFIISLILLDFTILPDLFESSWNSFRSVGSREGLTKRLEETTVAVKTFIFESNPLGTFFLMIVVLVFSLHLMNVTIVTDLLLSGWNFFTSVIPGLSFVEILVESILTVTVFVFGSFSSTVLFSGVLIVSLHLLKITILTDFFKSSWTRFMSANRVKILGTLTLTITMVIFIVLSSTYLVIGVVVFSLCVLKFTTVTEKFQSSWNQVRQEEPLVKTFGEAIKFIFESNPLGTSFLIIVVLVFSLHLMNVTIVTDLLLSGWNFFTSVIPGLSFVGILVESILTITVFVFGSVSSTYLVIGVLVFSLCVLKFTKVTDSLQSSWNRAGSMRQEEPLSKKFRQATKFIFVSNPLGTSFLIIVVLVFSLHLMNVTIVTDLLLSGWNFFTSVIPGLSFVGILVESILTVTVFVFGSVSSTYLVIGVLVFSLCVLKFTTVTDSFQPSWNWVRSVIKVYIFKVYDSERLVKTVIEKSTLLTPETGSLPTYKLPLKEKQNSTNGCKYFSFGKKSTKANRTIVVLGATGAGKTTVISGMVNHILGVKWRDSYRFKMVHEGQTMSQNPSEVTVYKIYHQEGFMIDYSLTIVDIPDFGEPKDLKVNEQLRKLFYSLLISEVDAVCFVTPASLTQLTPAQKSVFDSIFSVFGKDVAENIRILVTFADDQPPPVLEAIKASGVLCPKAEDGLPVHFKFNDSVLFVDNTTPGRSHKSDQGLWNMGFSSMRSFFAALICIKTIKLTLTNEALGGRQQVESSVEDLQMQVKLSLAKLEKIRETMEKVKENEAEVNKNEDFEFYVTVKRPVKVDISHTGHYITNCQQCQVTCHYPCGIPNDDGKRGCSAMGSNGYCTVCPGKCFWNVHFNQKFRWEYQEFKEKQTVKNLKEDYEEDTEKKMTGRWLIEGLQAEYDEVEKEMIKAIEISSQCLNRLKEMTQNPNPLSILEYIDMLIEGEKKEAKPGWNQRVDSLMKVREKA